MARRHERVPIGMERDPIDVDKTWMGNGELQTMGLAPPDTEVRPDHAIQIRLAIGKLAETSRQVKNAMRDLALVAKMKTGIKSQ